MSDFDFEVSVKMAGFYKVKIFDRNTGEVKVDTDFIKNKISTLGLNDIEEGVYGIRSTMFLIPNKIMAEGVSTGTGFGDELGFPENVPGLTLYPPYPYFGVYPECALPFKAPDDASLYIVMKGAQQSSSIVASSNVYGTAGVEPYWAGNRRTFRFDNDESITFGAVGLGARSPKHTQSWGPFTPGVGCKVHPEGGYSHTLFFSNVNLKDSLGADITLFKGPDDIVDVTFELRCYAPTGDIITYFDYEGVNYQARIRPAEKHPNSSLSWIASSSPGNFVHTSVSQLPINNEQSGPPSGQSINFPSREPYVRWSHQRKGNQYIPLDSGNFAGNIKSFWFNSWTGFGSYQIEFTPPIPKDRYKAINFSFGIKWSEYFGPP